MLPFFSKIKELSQTRVSGAGLAIFRLIFSGVMLAEVSKLFQYRHLLFDPIPYLQESEISYSIVLVFWLVVLLFLLIGWHTRKAALINYIFVLTTFSSFTSAKYHFDATLTGLSFLFLFLPVAHSFSLDRALSFPQTPGVGGPKVRKLYYYLPLLLIPGLQYLDSVFHKLASGMWLSGLGIWLPASLPNQIHLNVLPLLNQKWLVMSLSYLVILFEALFLFLIFFRKTRLWAALFGVGMHLSIGLIFPVPVFSFLLASIYLLAVPPHFWEKVFFRFSSQQKTRTGPAQQHRYLTRAGAFLKETFGTSAPYPAATPISETRKAWLFYIFIWYLLGSQFVKTLNAPLITGLAISTGLQPVQKTTAAIFYPVAVLNKKFLGITEGLIYTNFPEGELFATTLVYTSPGGHETWLPLLDPEGKVAASATGRLFTKWNRVNFAYPSNPQKFEQGLIQFSAFWAKKNHVSLKHANFKILQKKTVITYAWQADFLRKQLQAPWTERGQVTWRNQQATVQLNP